MKAFVLALLLVTAAVAVHGRRGPPGKAKGQGRPGGDSSGSQDGSNEHREPERDHPEAVKFRWPTPPPPSQYGGPCLDDEPVSEEEMQQFSPELLDGLEKAKDAITSGAQGLQSDDGIAEAVQSFREGINVVAESLEQAGRDAHALAKRAIMNNEEVCSEEFASGDEREIRQCIHEHVAEVIRDMFRRAIENGASDCTALESLLRQAGMDVEEDVEEDLARAKRHMDITQDQIDAARKALAEDLECEANNLGLTETIITAQGSTTTDLLLEYNVVLHYLSEGGRHLFRAADHIVRAQKRLEAAVDCDDGGEEAGSPDPLAPEALKRTLMEMLSKLKQKKRQFPEAEKELVDLF